MRLSVIPFNIIVDYLNLTSSSFVFPIFQTALLNALNSDHWNVTFHQGQHAVKCYEVQR